MRADARRNRARILSAAEEVFAERGADASTEEVARRAGVAIGTIFRHFPTKQDLLRDIMKDQLRQLLEDADTLSAAGADGSALFTFFEHVVEQSARKKLVVDLLAQGGTDIDVAASVRLLHGNVEQLLARARRAGTVRADVGSDELTALLSVACRSALAGGWSDDLRQRAVAIILRGMRPGIDQ
ncbi:TetR/AcrR family transcriptional regulator [Nocardia bovistercoris]|uniref:Helix-turn-helix transcriptional regulator n=1 Tax=Nocardia bovistercoris TaxID=2785916 RepID=A0A931IFR2_9NOCA|nr:TetR/AcrR family transcriptional regulator [Nocardia bovistercoris]MBH0780897.1 helix-turn-helix transcriptional regulator [Nocardia bovistercoris]